MHCGNHEGQGGQRGAFSRLVAARRASGGSSRTSSSTTNATPALRLPTIAKGVAGASSAPPPFTSSALPRSSDDIPTNRPSLKRGDASMLNAPAPRSLVVSERTPRSELLAIIAELQSDLSQRTDSVNAIQRNFQRLSAMHHAEQEELQRLRRLHLDSQSTSRAAADAQLTEQARVAEQLSVEVHQRGEQLKLLQEELSCAREEQRCMSAVHAMEKVCVEAQQHIVEEERASFADLVKAAAAEQACLITRLQLREEVRQQHAQLCALLNAHTSRICTLTQAAEGARVVEGQTLCVSPVDKAAEAFSSCDSEECRAELQRAESVVEAWVTAREAATAQRQAAEDAALRQRMSELSSKLCASQHILLHALVTWEEKGRSALEDVAADSRSGLLVSCRQSCEDAHRWAQYVAEARTQYNNVSTQCSARVDAWTASAEERLLGLRDSVDEWRQSREGELSAQRAALQHRGDEAHDLAAARTEWAALRDTERKTHRAELAHVRQDTAARIATAESRLKASQQQCAAVQKALEESQAAKQRAAEVAENLFATRVTEVVAEREALLSRQWFRVQSAQEEHARQVVELLWAVCTTRARCSEEELAARLLLSHAYTGRCVELAEGRRRANERVGAAQALWGTSVVHLAQRESAARLLIETAAQADFMQAAGREEAVRSSLQHGLQLSLLQQELHKASVTAEAAAAEQRRRAVELQAHLYTAEAKCRSAQERAADATSAAQEAQRVAQKAQEELRAFQAATAAAAQRIDAAESATESACCCPICLQLLHNPVACVPCGHVYCAGCLLWHARNKPLSSLTAAATPQHSRRVSGFSMGRVEVEVAQWMRALTMPQTRLYCPECGAAGVSTLVELRSLGELAAKFSYKKSALTELMRDLR